MSCTTRPAVLADLPKLLAFEQGIIAAERPYDPTLRPDPISYYDLRDLITSPDARVVVAQVDGRLVGSGYVRRKASRAYQQPAFHAFVGFMYVAPDHRGQGINQLILADLFAWARANDLPEVRLTVYPGNEAAVRAYTKVGFKPHMIEMRLDLEEKPG